MSPGGGYLGNLGLLMTPKAGALVVKERLERDLAVLSREGSLPTTSVKGPFSFPEDGSSGAELLAGASRPHQE